LLLEFIGELDRKAVLLLSLAASLTSACIIPVGPEWQNPAGAPNAPPQIFDPDPELGDTVTGTQADPREFQMFVTDVNVEDLEIKWRIDDFSPFSGATTIRSNGTPGRHLVRRIIGCTDISNKALSIHKVWAVVADRPFIVPEREDDPFAVEAPGHVAPAVWTLIMTCPETTP
jgi:hypothetical protein